MYGSSFECSCKTTFGLEVGEEVDSGAHAERDATLRDEHPNHPTAIATDRETQEGAVQLK